MKYAGLLLLFILGGAFEIYAQDTTEEDPLSDYSYLWETDSKKKSKKKKRSKKQDVKTVALDSTKTPEVMMPGDSVKIPQDSVQLPQAVPADSLVKEQPIEPEYVAPVDTVKKEPKQPKERKKLEGKPASDFRSGMAGGGGAGSFNGGLTMTLIDDQYFVGMTLQPEFKIKKIGVGLNIPILYGLDDQSIRTEMFKDGVGVARLITYIRYGVQKTDPVYVKVGQLNNTMIGFGGIVNNYTNSTSFEKRKIGIHYDINFRGLAGIEGMYSDFNPDSRNLLVTRPYIRPVSWTGIPIVETLEMGMTFAGDKDQTDLAIGDQTYSYQFTKDGVKAFGLDMGITVLQVPFIQIDLFANYTKLDVSSTALTDSLTTLYNTNGGPETLADGFSDGSGKSVGVNFRFNFIANILSTDVRIERLNYKEHYLPQFFDATYEINKDGKLLQLGSAGASSGIYGSLTGQILQKVRIGGSLMIPDEITEATPAQVRVNADLDRLADKFSFHGSYIKGNLSTLSDAFKFDERSIAQLRVIYHMNKFLATGLDYYWAFTPTADGGFKATKYISPYFGLSIQF